MILILNSDLGIDGVRIWDLSRNATAVSKSWNPLKITCPTGAGDRGATTSLAWIRRKDEPDDGLIYGTANGFIICWRDVSNGRESVSLMGQHNIWILTTDFFYLVVGL